LTVNNILVQIKWDVPYENSAQVTAYRVYVADADGVYTIETSYCNGLIEPVKSQRLCEIPMAVLRGPRFRLTFNTLIKAKIQAQNEFGWGEISDANTDPAGARIQTEPVAVRNVRRGDETSEIQIQVNWDPLTVYNDVRGSDIISYHLQYDAETNGAFWIDIIGINAFYPSTSFTLTYGIRAGRVYNFRVRALNLWGWGPFSEMSWVKSSRAPLAVPSI
jgi:hypothetical protein